MSHRILHYGFLSLFWSTKPTYQKLLMKSLCAISVKHFSLGICAHASKLLRPPSIQLLYLDPQKIFLHIVGTRDLKVTLTPLSTPEIILFTIKPLPHLLIIHSSPQLTLRVSLYHHASQMLMIWVHEMLFLISRNHSLNYMLKLLVFESHIR